MYQTCIVHAPVPCKTWDEAHAAYGEPAKHDNGFRKAPSATDPDSEAVNPQANGRD